ncbi:MAG: NAD(P)/FAD-dependent oxidoreductase, partial [Proteobacteria bacterium]|nr:NAD(P)/FAD-dependent oxidoreductase [Pseudomonadota bacterium]
MAGPESDQVGRVIVRADLSIKSDPDIFVIGDAALVKNAQGEPVPGIAPVAKQQGRFVAGIIARRIAGKPSAQTFRYRHTGHLATIGRRSAVIEFSRYQMTGRLAWWIWGIAHIYFLVGVP